MRVYDDGGGMSWWEPAPREGFTARASARPFAPVDGLHRPKKAKTTEKDATRVVGLS